MDLKRVCSYEFGQKFPVIIASVLVSAVLEWMLMFMLFVDSSFAYLITRFASRCKLQIPCLLCSRLDHVLGNERDGFYWDLICRRHKFNISSLVFCRLHNKLVDGRGTCESCFSSTVPMNKSNTEPYYGPSRGSDENDTGSSEMRKCMCCDGQRISSNCAQKLSDRKSINSNGAETTAESISTSKCNVDEVHDINVRPSQRNFVQRNEPLLPHVESRKVKINSDTESECLISDNECVVNAFIHGMGTSGQDSGDKYIHPEPHSVTLVDCPALDSAPSIKFSLPELENHSCFRHDVESEKPLMHELEELSQQTANSDNDDVSHASQIASFPGAFSSHNMSGVHCDQSRETNVTSIAEREKDVHVDSREVSDTKIETVDAVVLSKEVTPKYVETSTVGNDPNPESEIQIRLRSNKIDSSSQVTESLDLGDAYKLATRRQLSGRLLEQQRSIKDSARASEDLKLLLSQISSSRAIELPLNDMSPRPSANSDDLIQRRISLERNESNLSIDASIISETDGECSADHLKLQVEHDTKVMSTLYKELEEERNASAIAANQALAMITRLQEEKAAFNMEALHCLRMMEEQAEYDDEALQKANDLLAEKEKQIQDLEYELQLYRTTFEADAGPFVAQRVESTYEENNMVALNIPHDDKCDIINKIDGAPRDINAERSSLTQFEDEKQFILQSLKNLEERLYMLSKHEAKAGTIDRLEESAYSHHHSIDVSQENDQAEPYADQSGVAKILDENEGCDKFPSRIRRSEDSEFNAIRHELSVMSKRLEVLQAEQKVIECSINSLERGTDGFKLIQEIAVRIQELHSAHTMNEESRRDSMS